ncbi:MAG: nucleotidyltransferase domain-containing protein [Tannerella sp.]|nr:nucleotidyltransferase domain-containing protein [Tannerella sp.]
MKRELLPDERVILFGSQARGDARDDSDWDLLVLLNRDKKNFIEDSDKYAYPFTEMGFQHDVLINAKVFTEKEWQGQKPSLFYKNVEQDGIEIV